MENILQIEGLVLFGLTRQEAQIYMKLYTDGPLTGYEVSKLTGISRSNAYNGLAGLVEKGAAHLMEGAVSKYLCVDTEEFCDNKIHALQEEKQKLLSHMPREKIQSEGYITIEGQKHIGDKIRNMLEKAEQRVYLSMDKALLEQYKEQLDVLAGRGIKIVILSDQRVGQYVSASYVHAPGGMQIHVISDSQYVLTGQADLNCLYSEEPNFVNVFKEALRNEIKLIELTEGDTTK